MGLPREPGVPDLTDKPLPVAKGAPLPDAPKSFMPSPALGSDTAKVTVVVSSDFQCPVCRRVVEPVAALVREVPDVRVEFKQHALSSHRRAEPAAVASLAAHRQGKFWPYHDLLFQSQGALEDADLERYAEQVGLDMAQFRKDLGDQAIVDQVRAESKASDLLGARGTPAFFINGKMQVGWGSYFGFKQMVIDEAGAADAAIKAGTPVSKVYEVRAKANHEAGDDYVKYFIRGVPPAAD
jgi:protein-disulfide isomerase